MPTLDAIGLVASDLQATAAFYRLLDIDLSDPGPGEGHIEATLPSGIRLMVDSEATMASFSHWTPPTGGRPRTSLAVRCADPAEVDRLHATVLEAGHVSHVAPFDAPWGQRYATVEDPDGTPVDLYAPLP